MSTVTNMTEKQKYLQHIIPILSDKQIDKMISAVKTERTKAIGGKQQINKEPYEKLMSMVGCEEAKEKLNEMLADYRMRKISEAHGHKVKPSHFHAVFTGNPGCAKTTVARLFAQILAAEGITKNNKFIELTRSGIVSKYQGGTAHNVREVFYENRGGVIFIDEAYSLVSVDQSHDEYGKEAINEIIVNLENNCDTVVIFAGYPDKMEAFLQSNPGLSSRIPYRVDFKDYSTEELVEISKVIADENGYTISDSAQAKLRSIYNTAREETDYGNGRYVRNTIEAAVRTKGIKLGVLDEKCMDEYMDSSKFLEGELFVLDEECFDFSEQKKTVVKHRIGFCDSDA